MFDPKLKEALGRVQKPGRYTGGEPGSVYKDKEKVDVRFAFCFPDTYEVGMSFLGEKILYELLNSHENWWCERAFMPWLDMKQEMERLHIPTYALESKDPLTAFDIVGFTLQYELSYTNVLNMLELAGIRDIRTKSYGTNNKINMVKATLEGLKQLRSAEEVAKLRGKTVEEILG